MIISRKVSKKQGPQRAVVLVCIFCISELLQGTTAAPPDLPEVFNITRNEKGDTFSFKGGECARRECSGRTENLTCSCNCPSMSPLFREDLQQCVSQISECPLAPFGTGSSAQKIPLVYLPLKGQIIYPSKSISFPGVKTPICAVSGAQFLTRNGFIDLRSSVDSDVPFTLFRDEGRTFLQWAGEQEMRQRMEGRLLVVQLLCRDVAALSGAGHSNRAGHGTVPSSLLGVFTPCAVFRVAGSPSRHFTNITEVLFAPNARFSEDSSSPGLSMSEYIAIGISSVLLGLIYVASVFLYLHIKKKRAKSEGEPEHGDVKLKRDPVRKRDIEHVERDRRMSLMAPSVHADSGVIKSNPLLNIERHYHDTKDDFLTESDECQTDEQVDDGETSDELPHSSHQTKSITVHPMIHTDYGRRIYESYYKAESFPPRDENSIERLPEENVSIVETFDFRDDRPETLPVGSTRRKLYFNPEYFEPHLLMAPPPAAVEFLTKIREVITIAKHKMAAKRFTPSLGGIPEEDMYQTNDGSSNFFHVGSQRSSIISLKRENYRRKAYCSGCPGCDRTFLHGMSPSSADISSGMVCHNCSPGNNATKQHSIRKWLESVPGTKPTSNTSREMQIADVHSLSQYRIVQDTSSPSALGMLNSLLSLPKDGNRQTRQYYDFTSRSLYAEDDANNFIVKKKNSPSSVRSEPPIRTFNIPLPEFRDSYKSAAANREYVSTVTKIKDITSIGIKIPETHVSQRHQHQTKSPKDHRLPDMINEALVLDKYNKTTGDTNIVSGVRKHSTNKGFDQIGQKSADGTLENFSSIDYETDSLERGNLSKGLHTPTDYADVSSSQTSPALSTALPMDEEMTMRNAVYKVGSGSRPTSKMSNRSREKTPVNADHERVENQAELDENSSNAFENHIYNFSNPTGLRPSYSLVSEVYVNNGYNFGSAPTSPSESDTSTFGKRKSNPGFPRPVEQLGQLTIEVKDSPENYIKIHESDGFEPDTLDRKPSKMKIYVSPNSLDRLKSLGESDHNSVDHDVAEKNVIQLENKSDHLKINSKSELPNEQPLKKHNTKIQTIISDSQDYEIIENNEVVIEANEGRILTLESRHCKRQRESTPPNVKVNSKLNPPDIIPFEEANIYEYPKPPRLIQLPPPPLPPKNEEGRSPNTNKQISSLVASHGRKARAPTPPTDLPSGLRCPSGASVHSVQSSDYEKVSPVESHLSTIYGKTNPLLPLSRNNMSEAEHDIVDQVTCGKVTCVTSRPAPKFREFQTPKAGRKMKNPPTPRKSPKDRSGSVRKSFRKQGKKNNYKEDSGYLSTDSNESKKIIKKLILNESKFSGSETDESEDARSESGAESVETHSVFFGSFRKSSYTGNSADSGRSSDDRPASLMST